MHGPGPQGAQGLREREAGVHKQEQDWGLESRFPASKSTGPAPSVPPSAAAEPCPARPPQFISALPATLPNKSEASWPRAHHHFKAQLGTCVPDAPHSTRPWGVLGSSTTMLCFSHFLVSRRPHDECPSRTHLCWPQQLARSQPSAHRKNPGDARAGGQAQQE